MKAYLKTLFKDSWKITWHNPYLWLFGLFAAFFANNEINLIIANFKRINNWIDQLIIFKALQLQFQKILSAFTSLYSFNSKASYNLILTVIIALLFLYLSFLSQIAIISSVKQHQNKKPLSFRKAWRKGKNSLWPVVGIYVIALLVIYGFLSFLGLSFFYQIHLPIAIYVISFLILGLLVSFISRFAVCFVVLEKEKIFNSIKKGFAFFFKNWFITVKTSVYLSLVAVLIGLGLFLVSVGTAVPFLILIDLFLRLNLVLGFWLVFVFWTILIITFFLILGSIFSVWQFSVWTSLFLKLRAVSK